MWLISMTHDESSSAYRGTVNPDDPVSDYEGKEPLSVWEWRAAVRIQPPSPKVSKDYVPVDAIDLMKALNENRPSIIPTCDLPETYFHMMRRVDGKDLKIKISQSEDVGWSRIEVDAKEGKLAKDIFEKDYPILSSK